MHCLFLLICVALYYIMLIRQLLKDIQIKLVRKIIICSSLIAKYPLFYQTDSFIPVNIDYIYMSNCEW